MPALTDWQNSEIVISDVRYDPPSASTFIRYYNQTGSEQARFEIAANATTEVIWSVTITVDFKSVKEDASESLSSNDSFIL